MFAFILFALEYINSNFCPSFVSQQSLRTKGISNNFSFRRFLYMYIYWSNSSLQKSTCPMDHMIHKSLLGIYVYIHTSEYMYDVVDVVPQEFPEFLTAFRGLVDQVSLHTSVTLVYALQLQKRLTHTAKNTSHYRYHHLQGTLP